MANPAIKSLVVQKQGAEAFPNVSGWNDSIVLAAGTAQSYDLAAARVAMGLTATESLFIIFSSDAGFWADFNKTAVIPTGATANGSAAEYSPNQRYIEGNYTAISLISNATVHITMQFYRP